MSDAFQTGDERDAFPDTAGPDLSGLFPTGAIDYTRRLGTDLYNTGSDAANRLATSVGRIYNDMPTNLNVAGPEGQPIQRPQMPSQTPSIRYRNQPMPQGSTYTMPSMPDVSRGGAGATGNAGYPLPDLRKIGTAISNAASKVNMGQADDNAASIYGTDTSKPQASGPRDRSEYAYKPKEKSIFEKTLDLLHWSHPNNPESQSTSAPASKPAAKPTAKPSTQPAAPAASSSSDDFIKALTGNTKQNTTIAMGGANTNTQYPNAQVPMPVARPKNLGVIPQQKPAADANAPFLNNDPNDTRPGSLGEALKLFPNRPLQQAIYYNDPKNGSMQRLGVGADTSNLNPDNISRIWEPADMSGGEKFIRGAYETAGKNPLTYNPQAPMRRTSGPEVPAPVRRQPKVAPVQAPQTPQTNPMGDLTGFASGGHVSAADKIAREKATPCHSGIINMAVGGRTDHLPMHVLEGSYVLPADIVSALGEGNTMAGTKIVDQMFGHHSHQPVPHKASGGGMSGTAKANLKGAYILPADIDLGVDGSDYAGSDILAKMYTQGPGGADIPSTRASINYPNLMFPVPGNKALAEASAATGGKIMSGNHRPVPIVAAGGEYVIHPDSVAKFGGGDMNAGHDKLDAFVKYVRAHLVKTLQNLPGPKRD
jgi:hypothetical protein